ncbi:hypothetical protein ACFXK0_00040 [Nocardia sp. NPDC059177]|uniref:hypothetical protein n=1 Tax=Nocardia sp. NPDC059177 TaxID=3346759 RepID=UPI0036814B11
MNTLTRILITTISLLCAVGVAGAPAAAQPVDPVLAAPPEPITASPPDEPSAVQTAPLADEPLVSASGPDTPAGGSPVATELVAPVPPLADKPLVSPSGSGTLPAGHPVATEFVAPVATLPVRRSPVAQQPAPEPSPVTPKCGVGADRTVPAPLPSSHTEIRMVRRVPCPGSMGTRPGSPVEAIPAGTVPQLVLLPAPVPVRISVVDLADVPLKTLAGEGQRPAGRAGAPDRADTPLPARVEILVRSGGGSGSASELPEVLREIVQALAAEHRARTPRPHR